MKITDLKCTVLGRNPVVCITTDAGIYGLGEAEMAKHYLKPHVLCTYLYDLATRFSGFYENCPVMQSEEPVRSSRLALCELTARTLAKGLELLGIEHPERM